jgi:hypothetical protein
MDAVRLSATLQLSNWSGTMEGIANIRSGHTGDVVVISGHRVGEHERLGEILEVLGEGEHVHYRVRWDDGAESVFYPGSDATIRASRRMPAGRRPR